MSVSVKAVPVLASALLCQQSLACQPRYDEVPHDRCEIYRDGERMRPTPRPAVVFAETGVT